VPLVIEARDWQHGTFMGATMSSEKTAAAAGGLGQVRRDPMAMLPFLGYNAGDYFQHWVDIGKGADAEKLPKIFYVNWFRRGDGGRAGRRPRGVEGGGPAHRGVVRADRGEAAHLHAGRAGGVEIASRDVVNPSELVVIGLIIPRVRVALDPAGGSPNVTVDTPTG
jgi:hypothetical protein